MFREASDYPTRIRRATDRLRTRRPHLARPMTEPEVQGPGAAAIMGATALLLIAGLGYYFGPDLVRYLKIRRM